VSSTPLPSLFIHQKLDWTIARLQSAAERAPDDPMARVSLARARVSRGLYHGGGEKECNEVLALARKALSDDPANAEALVVAGLALLGMERPRAAARYLDQAVRIDGERADLRLAMGLLDAQRGQLGQAVRQLETACRLAPDAWETHLELGRTLLRLARAQNNPKRLVERAQYHLVQALQRDPPPRQEAVLLQHMGLTCMLMGRHHEAERFFLRLKEHGEHRAQARLHLGQIAYELGKYNNAIQHFRQFLRERPDDPKVLARCAMAWFQLGEYPRAREACHHALMVDPENVEARYALGCTLLEEGAPNEGMKVFREALRDRPDHLPSYIEMVRARRLAGDERWLAQALRAEVANHDRLAPGGRSNARELTRRRVRVVLDELRTIGPSTVGRIVATIPHTQSESLRFELWEAASELALSAVADSAALRLREPGRWYGPGLGGVALAAAAAVPEQFLVEGMNLDEKDLKRAAVDRHGPAHDVAEHRRNLDAERERARAYQALLLLAIGVRRSAAGKALLRKWAEVADPELAVAAWAGLTLYGEPDAGERLRELARPKRADVMVEQLLGAVSPRELRREPRRVSESEETACSTCGRRHAEVTHMIAGNTVIICDRCIVEITKHRASLSAPDEATCGLCGRSHFEASGLYRFNKVDICNHCVQLSLGLLEREEIERFLAAW
jgi:tetratricopeptide (TPR) repeat protein